MTNKNQAAADKIASESIGVEPVIVSRSYNVYNTGPAIPQIIQRGFSTRQEAEELAHTAIRNGVASKVSIIAIETKVRVTRVISN